VYIKYASAYLKDTALQVNLRNRLDAIDNRIMTLTYHHDKKPNQDFRADAEGIMRDVQAVRDEIVRSVTK
jgi:hypothetical protein